MKLLLVIGLQLAAVCAQDGTRSVHLEASETGNPAFTFQPVWRNPWAVAVVTSTDEEDRLAKSDEATNDHGPPGIVPNYFESSGVDETGSQERATTPKRMVDISKLVLERHRHLIIGDPFASESNFDKTDDADSQHDQFSFEETNLPVIDEQGIDISAIEVHTIAPKAQVTTTTQATRATTPEDKLKALVCKILPILPDCKVNADAGVVRDSRALPPVTVRPATTTTTSTTTTTPETTTTPVDVFDVLHAIIDKLRPQPPRREAKPLNA